MADCILSTDTSVNVSMYQLSISSSHDAEAESGAAFADLNKRLLSRDDRAGAWVWTEEEQLRDQRESYLSLCPLYSYFNALQVGVQSL